MAASQLYSIILALLTAAAAGLVGSFALMKRMTLAGDVVSHIALPGLSLAFAFKINPMVGAAATLAVGTLLIWNLEKRGTLNTDAAIGVVFIAALAIGVLLSSSEDLIDALFGGFGTLTTTDFVLGIAAAVAIITFILVFKERLTLGLFSPELAASAGLNVNRLNLFYLLVFSLTILLGLNFLGTLLVGALIIVPAAIGRQLTHTLTPFLVVSAVASVVSVALGFAAVAYYPRLALGPVIVTIASILFGLSLFKKKY